jgi:RNA polymerase sigma factor (TIGR02999 family)
VTRPVDAPDPKPAAGPMLEAVYDELRRIANGYIRRERARSIQPTELVHEAYLRLAKDKAHAWESRTHFVAIAAISMRRLLVERARARNAAKRGGGRIRVELDDSLLPPAPQAGAEVDVLALDHALSALAQLDPQQARIAELRFFGGLSIDDTAEALSVSPATVKRHWTMARAWLVRELERSR